jgi:[acyl-carrier-protein] S-malonyltransferase
MASIFIFPGQGSQAVGMGKDLYDNNTDARAIFEEVDSALNQKLSNLIFNGPIEELTMTANVQPAIFAVSMAMLRVSGGITDDVKYVAGHSLGEYTALCATGAINISDTAKLLRLRGDAMQRAVPAGKGAMAVIMGLEIDKVKEICEAAEKSMSADYFNVADVANDNCPGQVVISGGEQTILRAMEIAKEAGAKRAMLLPLSVPPHSRLMVPVAIEMQDALNKVEIKSPILPLISNKTTTPITDVNEIKEALVYQITHGVRWRETILGLPALGVTETIEVGPGAILTGMTPRIVPELSAKKLEV